MYIGVEGLSPDLQWEGTAALGPILLEENILQNELTELSKFPPESSFLLHTREVIQAGIHEDTKHV